MTEPDMPKPDMTEPTEPESLIKYPCDFPIKIMGKSQPGFAQVILEVVTKYDPQYDAATMEMRASKKANYVSLTCTVRATSRVQLDALYRELCDLPMVVMVL